MIFDRPRRVSAVLKVERGLLGTAALHAAIGKLHQTGGLLSIAQHVFRARLTRDAAVHDAIQQRVSAETVVAVDTTHALARAEETRDRLARGTDDL